MDKRDFEAFFWDASGFAPYGWQIRVAIEGLPDVLPIPTGLGKTEGAVLAWAWRRLRAGLEEPLHLVYCLPMRSLVRQTVDRLNRCFEALASKQGVPRVPVYQLMGGALDEEWAGRPDHPWVLVGTQDQLLSRALNRGYAMSPFEWPVHFGMLNQDCRWLVDEVQLMGPGLWTTAQLDWMRHKRFPALKACRTTWMSATVGTGFLATTDRKNDGLDTVVALDPRLDEDDNEEMRQRLAARRPVEWFEPSAGRRASAIHEQIASGVQAEHQEGTLTLVICNTVKGAQQVFRLLPDIPPRILLTSRFRRCDRLDAEKRLLDFEQRRSDETRRDRAGNARIEGDPGLVCVSTQVVEAGLDVSAHRLWSELAPWPSVIQRLGRVNRDGRDDEARARFWKTPKSGQEPKRDDRIGPYLKRDLEDAETLLGALVALSLKLPFTRAAEALEQSQGQLLDDVLQPAPAPLPRALDVHGLFSTERDVHGGFTDISPFVRGSDPDADVTVFWRLWSGVTPPRGDALDGLPFNPDAEGCAVAFHRLRDVLKARGAKAWTWNDEDERWESCRPDDLRPGMVVMLHRDIGGYDARLGWTGEREDRLANVERAGRGRALQDDERSENGYWARLDVHLRDTRSEAERICDALGLRDDDERLRPYRQAVVEAAGLHDLGKAHPMWQVALPAGAALPGGPWAKCPRVLAVDVRSDDRAVREAVAGLLPAALPLPLLKRQLGVRLRWAVDKKLTREELERLRSTTGVAWAGHVPLRPGMRHEAASALAMWKRYRDGRAPYPALAVYLAAAHHGKVRTVLRAISADGDDVFGIRHEPSTLDLDGQRWPFAFSVAADGAAGEWGEKEFALTDHGWTGLVADLIGPWRSSEEDRSDIGAVPGHEPRRLGPFVLAWLEALVRIADWRASARPSRSITPGEVSGGG